MSNDVPGAGEPEYLSSQEGGPLERSPRSGRRTGLLAGGAVGLALLVGAGAWAWSAYSSVGAQPSEALPADTLAYASVDLDPSGKQKIEAIRILKKFPAFEEEVGLDTDDDLRQRFFDEALGDDDCGLDYAADFEPWLGMRFAVAALPGDEAPAPVLVAQVSDADTADAALQKIADCEDSDTGGWEISGEWALIGEDDAVVDAAAEAAAEGSLAADDDFQRWTAAAGDPGVMSMYAAPDAAKALIAGLEEADAAMGDAQPGDPSAVPEELRSSLDAFRGAALTVRFADGALEVEGVTGGPEQTADLASDTGVEALRTLPGDTAAAIGFGLAEGWSEDALDRFLAQAGGDAEQMLDLFASETGLELPGDLETLLGDSTALALGSDFDVDTLINSDDGTDVPVGAKVQGDAEAIGDIVDRLQAAIGPGGDEILGSDASDDYVALGPHADYREQLLEDGDLGDSDAFRDVVREADDALAVVFVNFDANDWLERVADEQGDPEIAENLAPLDAAGLSTWVDGDDAHLLLRVTTDD